MAAPASLTLGFVGMFGCSAAGCAFICRRHGASRDSAAAGARPARRRADLARKFGPSRTVDSGQNAARKCSARRHSATDGRLAKQLHERRLFAAAASLLSETLVRSRELSQDADVLWLLGDSLSELGDLRGAKRYLGQFVDSHPTDGKAPTKLLALSSTLPADPMEKTWFGKLQAIPVASLPESANYVAGKLLFCAETWRGTKSLEAVVETSPISIGRATSWALWRCSSRSSTGPRRSSSR